MANLRIQSPLQFPGYIQTSAPGNDNQVLTYNGGNATWGNVPGVTADKLPCFFTYFLNSIEVKVPIPLLETGGIIPARDFGQPVGGGNSVFTVNNVTVVGGELPCRDFTNGAYVENNITLRT